VSVLLEALKKAAEEKKKALDDAVISDSDSLNSQSGTQELSGSEESSLSLVSETQAETPDRFLASTAGLTIENSTDDPTLELKVLSDSETEKTEYSQFGALGAAMDSLTSAPNELPVTDEFSSDALDLGKPPVLETSMIPPEVTAEEKSSFDWGMDALPGYSGVTPSSNRPLVASEQNPILISGALSEDSVNVKKRSTPYVLIVLIVILLFFGIGLYGLMYYQEQNQALENSMRKYELAKIRPISHSVKAPVTGQTITASEHNVIKNVNTLEAQALKQPEIKAPLAQVLQQVNRDSAVLDGQSKVAGSGDNAAVVTPVNIRKLPASVPKRKREPVSDVHANNKKAGRSTVQIQVNQKDQYLTQAYQAYELGHFQSAAAYFENVLNLDPKSITALLGLAAVAANLDDQEAAMNYYHSALEVQPDNLDAYEGIVNLSASVELNSEWKRSLIEMSKIYPASATLQYGLGNIYASEQDWLSAQEAFFNAYSMEVTNPDYMVNLAISLDQLGEYKAASQFYTKALANSGASNAHFNAAQIKNRLVSIQQFLTKASQ